MSVIGIAVANGRDAFTDATPTVFLKNIRPVPAVLSVYCPASYGSMAAPVRDFTVSRGIVIDSIPSSPWPDTTTLDSVAAIVLNTPSSMSLNRRRASEYEALQSNFHCSPV